MGCKYAQNQSYLYDFPVAQETADIPYINATLNVYMLKIITTKVVAGCNFFFNNT